MILYTMMPHEMIFPEEDQVYSNYRTISIDDGHVIVEQVNATDYKVIRLVSTNPMNYLNNEYTPGRMIQSIPR